MSVATGVVKETARTALKKNWLNAIIASAVALVSYFICEYIAILFGIPTNQIAANAMLYLLLFFFELPLLLGVLRYFWRLIFGVCDHPVSVFYYYSDRGHYWRALKLWAAICIRGLLFGILLFLPALAIEAFSSPSVYDFFHITMPLWASNLEYLALFFKSMASAILFFIMLRYYLAPFLAFADENADIAEVIHMSSIIAKTTAIDLLRLLLSFLGWALLSLLVVPVVFTLPYFLTAFCVHVRFGIAHYNKLIEPPTEFQNSPTYAARF